MPYCPSVTHCLWPFQLCARTAKVGAPNYRLSFCSRKHAGMNTWFYASAISQACRYTIRYMLLSQLALISIQLSRWRQQLSVSLKSVDIFISYCNHMPDSQCFLLMLQGNDSLLLSDAAALHPTVIYGTPATWEQLLEALQTQLCKQGWVRRCVEAVVVCY